MLVRVLVAFSSVVAVSLAIQCYSVNSMLNPQMQPTINQTIQDCGISIFTCVKIIDYVGMTVSKGCGPGGNCTAVSGYPNGAVCNNASVVANQNRLDCCCNGNMCNPAPSQFGFTPILVPLTLAFTFYSFLNRAN